MINVFSFPVIYTITRHRFPSSSISRSPACLGFNPLLTLASSRRRRRRRRRRRAYQSESLLLLLRFCPSSTRLILSSSPASSSWPAAAACWNPKALVDQSGDPGRRSKGAVWRWHGDGERAEPHGAVGGGPGPAVAAAAAGHELLRALPRAPGPEQERVQPLLPRLQPRRRRPLLLLRPRAPRPPRRPDTAVVVPQRDPGVGGGEADRHRARADVRDQQRQDRVPQRPAAGQARQGRHQHLRDLLPQPPGLVPILLPRMQARGDAVGPYPDIRHPAEA